MNDDDDDDDDDVEDWLSAADYTHAEHLTSLCLYVVNILITIVFITYMTS